MKGRLLIIFNSVHGHVRRYVDIIGNAVGCDAVPVKKFNRNMLTLYDKFVYIGAMRGGTVSGFKKIADYLDVLYDKLALCGVGMMPFDKRMPSRLREETISVTYEKFIPVFYAQGGFDASELKWTEKFMLSFALRSINAKVKEKGDTSTLDPEELVIKNSFDSPVDAVSKDNIQPLIDYLEGKPVSEDLYSPAEVTNPVLQKQMLTDAGVKLQ